MRQLFRADRTVVSVVMCYCGDGESQCCPIKEAGWFSKSLVRGRFGEKVAAYNLNFGCVSRRLAHERR